MLVLSELFDNAFKAIFRAKKGRVIISSDPEKRTLSIEDTACGISSSDLPLIFKPYFTKTKKGTGLGLYHCEMAMQDIGGDIVCTSKEGKFTKFTLSFPPFQDKKESV